MLKAYAGIGLAEIEIIPCTNPKVNKSYIKVKSCKFKKAISNMIDTDWKGAATEMLDSRWAKQTPNRANRLADIVREHG